MTDALNPVRLIMVSSDNNNKFYNMTPNGSIFLAEWGRVGVTSATKSYPIGKWNSIYNEKTKKGYKDVTSLVKTPAKKKSSGYSDISEPSIAALFDKLMGFAKTSVKDNYTIAADAVTQAQVKEAQSIVDELTPMVKVGATPDKVNKRLTDLYTVIPRKMNNVKNYLIPGNIKTQTELQFFRELIDNEQKTLDVMAGQVSMHVHDVDDSSPSKTILDSLGIAVELADSKDVALVKKLMGPDHPEFKSVFRVAHPSSKIKYESQLKAVTNKTAELFWHGSRNENWISILQTGLKIRPSNAVISGAMFGHGIYFADKYRKSAGYTSLRGSYWASGSSNSAFLSLMEVHVGKQYSITHHNHECYNLCKNVLEKKGNYDSVFAHGGADLRNNEYIVYTEEQTTIKYLVEVGK